MPLVAHIQNIAKPNLLLTVIMKSNETQEGVFSDKISYTYQPYQVGVNWSSWKARSIVVGYAADQVELGLLRSFYSVRYSAI